MTRKLHLDIGAALIVLLAAACSPGSAPSASPEGTVLAIVYDGTSATYVGPASLDGSGTFDIRLENDSSSTVDFGYGRHDPATDVSIDEVVAWSETETDVPPWIEESYHFAMQVPPGTAVDVTCEPTGCQRLLGERSRAAAGELMDGYRYELVVWDRDTERAFIATLIDVRASATE